MSRNSDDGLAIRGSKSKISRLTKSAHRGKLRIGDDWNAIRIIALSQDNPLKAIAEFVENSIDAHAKSVTITRGREHGEHYILIKDDGDGVPRDEEGRPNFKYVATHICDSIKRRLKTEGAGNGLQGEFGIGLLSFWTVGEQLTMISTGSDQRPYQMTMSKGDSGYVVSPLRVLFAAGGTELRISPLLEGIRTLSGEKLQWYLASELRDRIRNAKVRVTVIDKLARKHYEVEPRAYEGRCCINYPRSVRGSATLMPNSILQSLPTAAGSRLPARELESSRILRHFPDSNIHPGPCGICRASLTCHSSISRPAPEAGSSTMSGAQPSWKRCNLSKLI